MSVCNELLLNQQLCDAVIRVDNIEFPVHKNVLSECSSFFRELFTVWSTPDERDFDISMVTADIMKLIIDFAYTDSVTVTKDNVQELFKAADMLAVNGIVEACCSFMEEHLTPQNCIGIWLLTGIYYTPETNRKVFSFIMMHFEEVAATSEEFPLLSVHNLVRIIEEDQLNVKQEKMVFEAVLRWINHATDERREYIHQLLSNVRLVFMSTEYLKDILSNNELVRASEECQQLISMTLETKLHHGTQRFSDWVRPRLPPAILFAVGGLNHHRSINGIEAYDVRADCWVTITDKDKSPRNESVTVFHNGSLYSVGGINLRGYISSLQRFDLRTKTWHEQSNMHYRRRSPGVTVLDGYIYAVGGANGEYLRTAERYDPRTNQWTLITPMNERRSYNGCTNLNGKVYICGGYNGDSFLASAECYDPATNQWTLIADMGSRRCDHGVIAYAGRVFAVGGWRINECLKTAEAYDPHTNTWNNMPSMLERRSDFGMEVIDDRLFVVGGFDDDLNSFTTTVQCFDINTGQWSEVCSMNFIRGNLSCCVVAGLPNLADYAAPRHSLLVSEEEEDIVERSTDEEDIVE